MNEWMVDVRVPIIIYIAIFLLLTPFIDPYIYFSCGGNSIDTGMWKN